MTNISHETKLTLLYIALAFLFSVTLRFIWVTQFSGYEPFYFHGQFMINTNDGYYWAEGARDLLSGSSTNPSAKDFFDTFHQLNDRSPVDTAASQLTAFFAAIFPVSFESIIFYMPVFLSSLIVVPIILIAKSLKNLEMGFIAALLASITWSYYNRTMIGYYDTDMLNIVLPMFLLWSIIWAIQTNKNIYLLLTALDILVYRWWYPQSYSLEFSFFGLILIYALFLDKKNLYNYKLLTIMLFAMMGLGGELRAILIFMVFYVFNQKKYDKYVYNLLSVALVAFFISGGLTPLINKLSSYIVRDTTDISSEGLGLHFFSVMQTVREAGHISFETFANRISGHTITFIISFMGYLYLLYKHRIMLFSIPLVGLGFLAYVGGLRFTIYAVPILAFGVAFLITEFASKMPTKKLKILSIIMFTLAILYPNYKHIDEYRVPTVFTKQEVQVLETLKDIAQREDYVVSWWDYGYPIRYYADVKTLVDGGKHSGSVNFPVSYILTHTQEEAAKMARLDVEYTEKTFLFTEQHKEEIKDKNITVFSNIEQMTKDYDLNDTNDFLSLLGTDIELPKKTRDIYFYLPFKMLNIYPTVTVFSNIDLMNGKKGRQPFFFMSRNFKDAGDVVDLGSGVRLNKREMSITIGKDTQKLRRFVQTAYTVDKTYTVHEQLLDFQSNVSLIYLSSYNMFLLVDEKVYNSLYIQLMVLDKYDKKLFKKIIDNPYAKVFKLKV